MAKSVLFGGIFRKTDTGVAIKLFIKGRGEIAGIVGIQDNGIPQSDDTIHIFPGALTEGFVGSILGGNILRRHMHLDLIAVFRHYLVKVEDLLTFQQLKPGFDEYGDKGLHLAAAVNLGL